MNFLFWSFFKSTSLYSKYTNRHKYIKPWYWSTKKLISNLFSKHVSPLYQRKRECIRRYWYRLVSNQIVAFLFDIILGWHCPWNIETKCSSTISTNEDPSFLAHNQSQTCKKATSNFPFEKWHNSHVCMKLHCVKHC